MALIVGERMWEEADRLRPRRVLVAGKESLRDRARRITAYWSAGVYRGLNDATVRYNQQAESGREWTREMYARFAPRVSAIPRTGS